MKKIKSLVSKDNAKGYVEFIKKSGMPYTLKISNYTTEIESDLYNIQFLQSLRSKQCFAAFAKIKSDIKNINVPLIDEDILKYFEHDFSRDMDYPTVINIDLKSAYATALYNAGFVSANTYDYLQKIPKIERLASVGMLAGKKYIFHYSGDNKLIGWEKKVSDKEGFFYFAVREVQYIMDALRLRCGDKYLFTWVDGIYLLPDEQWRIDEIKVILDKSKYFYTIEELKDFKVRYTDRGASVIFTKGSEQKFFNVPPRSSQFAKDIIYELTGQNPKQIYEAPIN